MPVRIRNADAVSVNAADCDELATRMPVPIDGFVKFKFCDDTPEKTPTADAVFVKAEDCSDVPDKILSADAS